MQVSRIRELIKARNKKRGQTNRIQRKPPPAKRRKPNETNEDPHPEIQEMQREEGEKSEQDQEKEPSQPKRKPEQLEEQSKKRPRVSNDIRNHFQVPTPNLDREEDAEDTGEARTPRDNGDAPGEDHPATPRREIPQKFILYGEEE